MSEPIMHTQASLEMEQANRDLSRAHEKLAEPALHLPLGREGLERLVTVCSTYLALVPGNGHLARPESATNYFLSNQLRLKAWSTSLKVLEAYVRDPESGDLASAREAWTALLRGMMTDIERTIELEAESRNDISYTESEARNNARWIDLAKQVAQQAEALWTESRSSWAEIASEVHANRAEKAEQDARVAAGDASSNVLTQHYSDFAKAQDKSSKLFRKWTVGLVVAAIALPFALQHLGPADRQLPDLVIPLVAAAGLFGLAGYFARQAHLHRTLATWAESIKIQLLTFRGYIGEVQSLDQQDELRVTFAGRVFGPHPKLKGEVGVTASSPIIDSIITKMPKP